MNKRVFFAVTLLVTIAVSGLSVHLQAQSNAQAATPAATSPATPCVQSFTLFDLNTSTGDQFLTIPTMNSRMVREYMEYRPYTSILQFRKEIGKYVGADQTTAWEKYIYVPVQVDSADVATLKQIPGIDDQMANALIAARPFNTNEAFLAKLATLLTPDQVTFAKNYLEVKDTATMAATQSGTPAATMAAVPCATQAS